MIAKDSPSIDSTARSCKRFDLLDGRETLIAKLIRKRAEGLALQGGPRGGDGGFKTGDEAGPVGDNVWG